MFEGAESGTSPQSGAGKWRFVLSDLCHSGLFPKSEEAIRCYFSKHIPLHPVCDVSITHSSM